MFKKVDSFPADLRSKFPIIQSVLDGTQQGKVFGFKDSYFIAHKSGFCQFLGDSAQCTQLTELFVDGSLEKYFHVYDPPEILTEIVVTENERFNHKIRTRIQLEYGAKAIEIMPLNDFKVAHVSAENFETLEVFGLHLSSRFWSSSQDFVSNSSAMVAFDSKNKPVSICYSAATALGKAEVDVLTLDTNQGKGLGKLVTSHFINCCLKQNIVPNWDCFEDNVSSLKTAISLDFKQKRKYIFLSLYRAK
jgi:hypothetical protein